MKFLTLLSICLIAYKPLNAQWDVSGAIQLEVGLNAFSKTYISFSASAGVKRQMFYDRNRYGEVLYKLKDYASTGFQTGVTLYYNGLGDNILDSYKKARLDFVSTLMASVGTPLASTLHMDRVKVVPFNSFLANSLSDEYHHSLTIGSNVVLNTDRRNQVTGFTNLNFARTVRIGYMNDGPPFGEIGLGDRYDRWWTGSGFIEIFLDQGYVRENHNSFWDSRITATFDRFTGDVQEAFEIANLLGFKHVPAYDIEENYYNRARLKVGFESFSLGYEISYQALGKLELDYQDMIHKRLAMPHHMTFANRYSLLGLKSTQSRKFIDYE